jgi:hypothetical protein
MWLKIEVDVNSRLKVSWGAPAGLSLVLRRLRRHRKGGNQYERNSNRCRGGPRARIPRSVAKAW